MAKFNDRTEVFRAALENQQDRTEDFFAHFGHDPLISGALRKSEISVKNAIRAIMQKSPPPKVLFNLDDKAAPDRKRARMMLDEGLVAAVDGTNALDPSDMMTTGFYGCAIGYVTSRKRSTPVVKVTQTSSQYADPKFVEKISNQELQKLCQSLDKVKEEQSWPTTFREYIEREVAIDCQVPVVLIDGPIFTQNLSTQTAGRALLDRIKQEGENGRTFIGVIKNISSSWTMTKWCGFSLLPREGFVVMSIADQLRDRYRDSDEVSSWAAAIPDEYVRVVFRPCNKAFGMECRLRDLSLAMAIMLEDASQTLNHELPLLIETVDAQIRAGFDARAAQQIVHGKIREIDLQMGNDVTDERDYR